MKELNFVIGSFKELRRLSHTVKEKPTKKIFGGLIPWKPISLPPGPTIPQLPKPASLKALKAPPAPSIHRRELFEPILSRTIEMDKLATEVILRFRDIDGEHEIKTCYGDIYKIVNVFMDYARLLEAVNDEWGLDPYRRAVNEVTADKLRSIAKKYQEAIGYDYEDALVKCEAKKKKARKDDDVGSDALELAFKKNQRNAAKKEK
jgi:hypothetical protein